MRLSLHSLSSCRVPGSAIGSSQPRQGGTLHLPSVTHSFIHKHELNSLLSALVAIKEDFPEEAANSDPCLAVGV